LKKSSNIGQPELR